MVAISGLIIPEPFATPVIVTNCPAILTWELTILGLVSVVIIAVAALSHSPGVNLDDASATASATLLIGKNSPITPVENG